MEENYQERSNFQREVDAKKGVPFSYFGDGMGLFKIHIVNLLLTVVTLGFYYPWAKAKLMQYNYAETEFKGDRFTFHGTGMEMFIGMLKAMIPLIVLMGCVFGAQYAFIKQQFLLGAILIILYLVGLALLLPLAIVGSLKYRASRSSWRGIHFNYKGTVGSMLKVYLSGFFFTIITFGIYGAWFYVDLLDEITENLTWGNIKMKFKGEGSELFWIQFKPALIMFGALLGLALLTALLTSLLGNEVAIVMPVLMYVVIFFVSMKLLSDRHNFVVGNIRFNQEGNTGGLEATTTASGFMKLYFTNALIVVFTLGLGLPWAIVRHMKYIADTTLVKGYVDFDNLKQGEIDSADATGEGILDGFDLDVGI